MEMDLGPPESQGLLTVHWQLLPIAAEVHSENWE